MPPSAWLSNFGVGLPAAHAPTHIESGSDEFLEPDVIAGCVTGLRDTSGPTILPFTATKDGWFMQRSGSTIIGAPGLECVASETQAAGTGTLTVTIDRNLVIPVASGQDDGWTFIVGGFYETAGGTPSVSLSFVGQTLVTQSPSLNSIGVIIGSVVFGSASADCSGLAVSSATAGDPIAATTRTALSISGDVVVVLTVSGATTNSARSLWVARAGQLA